MTFALTHLIGFLRGNFTVRWNQTKQRRVKSDLRLIVLLGHLTQLIVPTHGKWIDNGVVITIEWFEGIHRVNITHFIVVR